MKKILTILLLAYGTLQAQSFSPTLHTALSKPTVISISGGGPLDAVSMFYDAPNFKYRDYRDTGEVKSYLNAAKWRSGKHTIFVHSGGTLNGDATYTGGTTVEWWFKNGVADSNLVEKANSIYFTPLQFATRGIGDTVYIKSGIDTAYNLNDTVRRYITKSGSVLNLPMGNVTTSALALKVAKADSIAGGYYPYATNPKRYFENKATIDNSLIIDGNNSSRSNTGGSQFGIDIGYYSGEGSDAAYSPINIGTGAAQNAPYNHYGINIGWFAGNTFSLNTLGKNNIIIGNNISLPNLSRNKINIGGVLFGSRIYDRDNTDPSVAAKDTGRIGINVVNPTQALDVHGQFKVDTALLGTLSMPVLVWDSASGGIVKKVFRTDFGSGGSTGVTSIATNNATGITGGPITSTGTIAADTTVLRTVAAARRDSAINGNYVRGLINTTNNNVATNTANIALKANQTALVDSTAANTLDAVLRRGNTSNKQLILTDTTGNKIVTKYIPTITANPNLSSFNFGSADYPTANTPLSSRPNHVFVHGYNVIANGTALVAGEPTLQTNYETFFQNASLGSGTSAYLEYHVISRDTSGLEHRLISYAVPRNGLNTAYGSFAADQFIYNKYNGTLVVQTNFLTGITDYSQVHSFRFGNPLGYTLSVKNNANSAFLNILSTDASDRIVIGSAGEVARLYGNLELTNGKAIVAFNANEYVNIGNSTKRTWLYISAPNGSGIGIASTTQDWRMINNGAAFQLINTTAASTRVVSIASTTSDMLNISSSKIGIRKSGVLNATLDVNGTFASDYITADTLYGQTIANGRLSIFATNSVSNGTSNIALQPTGGSVVIGDTSAAITAILDIKSTALGILIPRMTEAERDAISSPAPLLQIASTTGNQLQYHNGTNWTNTLVTSAAATLTLTHGNDYIFTGTTSTWTLPAVSATLLGRGNSITIKNRGSGAITLNSNAGSTIYDLSAVGTFTINPGEAIMLMPGGTFFNIE